ncbi:restriction endonuclease subunit S [Flavobacterium sp. W20_MBD1_R3]|uniref:restriction endonuclease subunit S n=1 Tax=Flavobacterium sp. W20_MBD1_R3 TaxID=3240278 RepID=UPI003F8FA330
MREGWKEVTIEKISSKLGDGLHGTPKYDDNGEYYFINGNNLQNGKIIIKAETKKISFFEYNKIKKKLNDRTLLVAINGTIGNVGLYTGEKVALGKSACYFNVIDSVEKNYIRYVLESSAFQNYAQLFATGATIKNLSLKAMRSFSFHLPELQTQRKIASILSSYDDLIENNLRRIQLLEEKAQLTYEEWFVKMRFPGYETAKLDEVTGLPEGWEKVKLGELLEVTSSKRIFLSDYVEEGIPFYRGKEIILKSKNETINDLLYISKNKFEEIKKKYDLPKTGDILVTAVGTLGYPYLVTESDGDFYFKDGNLIWLKNSQLISSTYLICCFKNENFQSNLKNTAIGSSQKALTISSLKDILILNPKSEIQLDFDSLIIPLYNSIENLQNQKRLLKETRNILLPRLMSGMIDVEEITVQVLEEMGNIQTTE